MDALDEQLQALRELVDRLDGFDLEITVRVDGRVWMGLYNAHGNCIGGISADLSDPANEPTKLPSARLVELKPRSAP